MASSSSRRRARGAELPLHPIGFVLPYFGHFRADLPIIGFFMTTAWSTLLTIPLLSSSFNVYFDGAPASGEFRWVASQGPIWAAIGLYAFLIAALLALMMYLRIVITGLKWDPRSLADVIVLLERSNALDMAEQEEAIPQLGLWHTTHRPNEVFLSYALESQPARSYAVEDGRIREKTRFSDPNADLETGHQHPKRWSRVAMLHSDSTSHGNLLPWFLRPSLALLWPIMALVLLLAFLIVSYLPSTTPLSGFPPLVDEAVTRLGWSDDNFLYTFLPTSLALLCYLFACDIDMSHRRLAPLSTLLSASTPPDSATAERTLLAAYPSMALPLRATLSALFNTHLRVALLSFVSLLSLALPVCASGVFFPQFSVPAQRTLIYADPPGLVALAVFAAVNAVGYFAAFPGAGLRRAGSEGYGSVESWRDWVRVLGRSLALDDVAFRDPRGRTVLVTRLLAGDGGVVVGGEKELGRGGVAGVSKVSLADSVRGFGRAREAVGGSGGVVGEAQRWRWGSGTGRDGREWVGIDRVGR